MMGHNFRFLAILGTKSADARVRKVNLSVSAFGFWGKILWDR